MTPTKQYIAVDLGAESGRIMLSEVSGQKLSLKEIYRFSNSPVEQNNSLRWDFEMLFSEIKAGLVKAINSSDVPICGIGVDSWGVDFGLVDEEDKLIENPYHYRDSRTDGMMDRVFELMPKRAVYESTGIQFMQINTMYQLLAMKLSNSKSLEDAQKLIFMADLVSFHLCGRAYAEYTLASTSQLLDMKQGCWSREVFEKLSLPIEIMPEVITAGTIAGKLKGAIASELGCAAIDVIAIGSHDTASAVAAVPTQKGDNWAFLSSGTWSLMGVEVPEAIINNDTFNYQFTNEGGVKGTIRLLKNIMGLWLVQESRRQWQRQGEDLSYSELADLAQGAQPFVACINPNHSEFLSPGDMPGRINKYLADRGQPVISDKGQMIRVILESLAFNYRWVLEKIEEITGKDIDVLHIIGGGIQNELLCQFTADSIGRKVIAGPIEATASGNIVMQAVATGQIKSVRQAREIVKNSFELTEYIPSQTPLWNKEYGKIKKIFD